jgi:hypothetical protein
MSFNITSDGSPTPRKGPIRFPGAPGDLRVKTAPEGQGQAVGTSQTLPFHFYHPFGSSLTSDLQGTKQPLSSSTLGNQAMSSSLQQNSLKVSNIRTHH